MKRIIEFDKESRQKLKEGVDGLAKAVSVTLGPKGRNVVIKTGFWNGHHTTKDGVTVAKEIYFDDPIENLGAEMVKSVAINTVNDTGDGTSTATVLAQSILEEGLAQMEKGGNPVLINRGIQKATQMVVDEIKKISTPITTKQEVIDIATISANGDKELGKIIGESMFAVGIDGSVSTVKNNNSDTFWEMKEGITVDTGWFSPYFVNKESSMSCILDQPLILVYDDTIRNVADFFHLADYASKNSRPFVVICNDMQGEALQFFITNAMQKKIQCVVMKSPGFGENKKGILNDIALATGTEVASENNGLLLPAITPEMLGTCGRIDVSKTQTVVIGNNCNQEDVDMRVTEIKEQIKNSTDETEIEDSRTRISKLSGKIGIIRLGAKTDLEYMEKLDRVDDALSATKAGLDEGIVAGGGIALIRCKKALEDNIVVVDKDEKTGFGIVMSCLDKPLRVILDNAGLDSQSIKTPWWRRLFTSKNKGVLNTIIRGENNNYGYDAREGVFVKDMIKSGIIDPSLVTICALQNASSIAGLILTTECVIIDVTEYK